MGRVQSVFDALYQPPEPINFLMHCTSHLSQSVFDAHYKPPEQSIVAVVTPLTAIIEDQVTT